MHFSPLADSLTSPERNALYQLHERIQGEGHTIVDLVKGNVNEHGIVFPPDILKEILAEAVERARIYRPDSFGQPAAREAIARYYGATIPAPQFVVTPGTSISYWYCFKLLAEPGDEILTPQPTYPLFDYIAQLCGVTLKPYRLDESRAWAIDVEHLESQIGARTRAIVLISPHNPTGMVADNAQLRALADVATRRQLPIIADEVFSEFVVAEEFPRIAATHAPLVFTLNGFSKMFAMPGMKIGWIGVSGEPENFVERSLGALEMISDTFLPVNEAAQFAVPAIFEKGAPFLAVYRNWVAHNRAIAVKALTGCHFVAPAGGFYITLRVPNGEDAAAERLLAERHILVHPGYFYDIEPDHLVMTFVHDPQSLDAAFTHIAEIAR